MSGPLRFNPFRPGGLVLPGMFVGRTEELQVLERVLFQTKNENPLHFMIRGERGIGKSSLLLYLDHIARGKVPSWSEETFNFLTVRLDLEPNTSYAEIIRKVGGELKRVVMEHQKIKTGLASVLEFITNWEVLGIKYSANEARSPESHELLDDLTFTVKTVADGVREQFDGILIMIDEADKAPASANLGEFCKLFTERLISRGCQNVALGLAGLPNLTTRLRDSHESSVRIFQDIFLKPLEPTEREAVVASGLEEAEAKSSVRTTITDEAKQWISAYSEGFPHFIQQFAASAFDADQDNNITEEDVRRGAFGESGAIHQLGVRFFRDMFFEQTGSDQYRTVLREMAKDADDWITKGELARRTKLKSTTLTNAIAALRKNNIIVSKEGKKGVYRLPTIGFAVWIRIWTSEENGNPL